MSHLPKSLAMLHATKTIAPGRKGQAPITFKEGGLHQSTETKQGEPISEAKHEAAASGQLGGKAEKQERFYQNVLKHGK